MDNNRLNSFEEIMKYCGYKKCNNNSQTENNNGNNNVNNNVNNDTNINGNNTTTKVRTDPTAGASTNKCRYADLDLLFGFQDADPMFVVVICEIVSNVISGKIPVNVAGAFGNWLQLIAQVMTLFIAQQQYQQSGPGRYYNPIYRNVTNPFCINDTQTDGGGEPGERREEEFYNSSGNKTQSTSTKPSKSKNKKSRKNKSKRNNNNSDIRDLKNMIKNMQIDIQNLKKEIFNLKNNS